MTPENLAKFTYLVTKAIETHVANGGTLQHGGFGFVGGPMCPLSCVMGEEKDEKNEPYCDTVARVAGFPFPESEMWEFITGFDASKPEASGHPLYQLGAQLRAKYLPPKE